MNVASSTRLLGLLVVAALLAPEPASAQERGDALPRTSPNASVAQSIGVAEVRITYGRPHVRGREIFGDLVPFGKVWRTGANEATTITLSADATVEGRPLEAGTYGLFTIPGPDQWTIIFNETAKQWGAFEYDASQDVLRVEVTPEEAPLHEMMTFVFEEVTDSTAQAVLYWDQTRVPITIAFDTRSLVQVRAASAMENTSDWRQTYRYAAWALEQKTFLKEALRWVERSLRLEKTFPNTALKARLLATTGNHEEAVRTAEQALSIAESMKKAPNGLDSFKEQVSQWRNQL